jgi:predicted DNA-binding transcriptional regulator AlpA
MSQHHASTPTAVVPLLRIADLTRWLACDVRTLDRMRSSGRFPAPDLVVGRRSPRWRAETIREWLDSVGKEVQK